MKPRWAPRWFAYVGLGPNPALPRPVGDSMPKAFDSGDIIPGNRVVKGMATVRLRRDMVRYFTAWPASPRIEDAVATVVQYLDDIAEESEQ